MLFSNPRKPAPIFKSIASRPKAIVIKGLWTYDDEHAYFKGYRYDSESDALADINATDLDDEIRSRRCRDDDDLTPDATYWYRFSSVDVWGNESDKSAPVSANFAPVSDSDLDQTAPGKPKTPTLINAPGDYDGDDGTVENGLKLITAPASSGRAPSKYFAQLWRRPVANGAGTTGSLEGYTIWEDFQMRKPHRRFRANGRFYYKAQVTPIVANIWGTPSDVTADGVRPTRSDSDPDAPSGIYQRNRGDRSILYTPNDDAANADPRFGRTEFWISDTDEFADAVRKGVPGDNKFPLDDYDAGDEIYVWARYVLRGGKASGFTPDSNGPGQHIAVASQADGRGALGLGSVATLDIDADGTLAANSDTRIATQKAVKTYADALNVNAVYGPASAVDSTPAVFDGTTGKLIKNISYATFKTSLVLVKGDVGLGNVDNTSDVNKPVSTAQQAALDLKLALAGGTMGGALRADAGIGIGADPAVGVPLLISKTGGAAQGFLQAESSAAWIAYRATADAGGAAVSLRKSRGTIASPALVSTSDVVGQYEFRSWTTGSTFATLGLFGLVITEGTPSATQQGSQLFWSVAAVGTISATVIGRLDWENGLRVAGSRVKLDSYGARGDADFTLTAVSSPTRIKQNTTLTANRTVTLSTTGAISGDSFTITRTSGGAFNLNVGTGPLKALATNTWCTVTYDGSAWYLAAYGAL
jgi:hypothetical protein